MLTQVTALNMIIAIMGDTFGRVLDCYEMHSRAMKISLLSDYVEIIRGKGDSATEGEPKDSFLVVVKRVDD